MPARPVKKRFNDEIIHLLQDSEWWYLPSDIIKQNFSLFNMEPTIESAKKICDLKNISGDKRC